MKKNVSVKEIMTKDLLTVSVESKFSELKKLFCENRFHHLPVIANDKIVGMVSSNDVLRYSFSEKFVAPGDGSDDVLDHSVPTDVLMQDNLVCIKEDTSIREAAQLIHKHNFQSLPVLDDNEKLVGLVTGNDLIRYLVEQY